MKEVEITLPQKRPKSARKTIWQQEIQFGSPVKLKEKQQFYQQWSLLLDSGLPLLDSLILIEEQTDKSQWKGVIQAIQRSLQAGKALSQAFESHSHIFGPFECQSIFMAEQSGQLPLVLQQLGLFFEKRVQLKRKVWQALSYPLAVIGIAGLVLAFMLGFVVPMFADIFSRFDAELPLLTQWIMAIADSFKQYSAYLLGLTLFGIISAYLLRNDPIWLRIKGKLLLRLPYWGKLFRKLELARMSYTLSLLLKAQVHLDEALATCAKLSRLPAYQQALLRIRTRLQQGMTYHQSLSEEPLFPPYFRQMARVGEESANLPLMTERLAQQLETESETTIGQLTQFLEPLLIVLLGGIVAVILVAMYLPMFTLSQAMVQ